MTETTKTSAMSETTMQSTINEQYDSLVERLGEQVTFLKSMMTDVKALKKEALASEKKKTKKIKKEVDPNKPKPFTKPVEITDELRKFLKQDGDISRTEVTQKMYAYIKEESLQNEEHKRQFILDTPLAKLFKLDKGTSMEYFKLQTYMKQHYPK